MLTFMTVGLGAAAALAAPALLAVYLFRHRHRRVDVSTLMLWQSVARVREGGRTLRRTRIPWLFFVELLFLLLCALAAAGPRWLRTDARRPLVVVADNSASMGARTAQDDRLAEARRIVRAAATDRRWRDVRFVLAGPVPRRFDALGTFEAEWSAEAPSADLPSALRMARRLAEAEGQVLVVTDAPPAEGEVTGDTLRWVAVGQPLDNRAIVQSVRSPRDAETDACLLGIANYGAAPAEVTLSVAWEHAPSERHVLALAPGVTEYRTLVAPRGAGIGRFNLERADALALDDAAVLVPSPSHVVPVAVTLPPGLLRELVVSALDATGVAELGTPADSVLTIKAGDATPSERPNLWRVRIHQPPSARTLAGPFLRETGHPLLEGMDLQGVAWGASTELALPGDPVLRAGNTALVAVGAERRGGMWVELQMVPERSTVQRTPDWPVFFANLLAWCWSEQPPGLAERNVRCGATVPLRVPVDADGLDAVGPDGRNERLVARTGKAVWQPRRTGLHTLRWAGSEAIPVGVNFTSPDESDLRQGSSGVWGDWRAADSQARGIYDLAWVVLLLGLLVLLWHQALLR